MSKKTIMYLVGAIFELLILAYAIYLGRTDAVVINAVVMINFIARAILEVRKWM